MADIELWARIPESQIHEVSSHGRIRSIERIDRVMCPWGFEIDRRAKERILKPYKVGKYLGIRLSMNSQNQYMHRLVAAAFVPNPDGGWEINHKDGDKKNNRADNLEWCTKSYNQRHATHVLGKRGGQFGPGRVRIPAGG